MRLTHGAGGEHFGESRTKNRPLVTFSHTWAFLFFDYAKFGAMQETSRAGGEFFFIAPNMPIG